MGSPFLTSRERIPLLQAKARSVDTRSPTITISPGCTWKRSWRTWHSQRWGLPAMAWTTKPGRAARKNSRNIPTSGIPGGQRTSGWVA